MCYYLFSIIYKVIRDLRNNERAESLNIEYLEVTRRYPVFTAQFKTLSQFFFVSGMKMQPQNRPPLPHASLPSPPVNPVSEMAE